MVTEGDGLHRGKGGERMRLVHELHYIRIVSHQPCIDEVGVEGLFDLREEFLGFELGNCKNKERGYFAITDASGRQVGRIR